MLIFIKKMICIMLWLYNFLTEFDHDDIDHLLGIDATCQKKASALFLMKLKESRHLSQPAIDDIVEGCRLVFSHTVKRIHSGVHAKLAKVGIEEDVLDDVFFSLADPFTGLETRHLQEKCFKEDFGLVVSVRTVYIFKCN